MESSYANAVNISTDYLPIDQLPCTPFLYVRILDYLKGMYST